MHASVDREEKKRILAEIKEKLKEKGLKITEARLKVISHLIDYGKHFEIEDLVVWIRERCKDYQNCPSRPTVYRTVKLLEDLGYVKPVLEQGNTTVYEFLPIEREHYHLLCLSCGKLVEFEEPAVGKIVQEIAQKMGFKYLHHHLEVCGICPECPKREEEEEEG